MELLADKILTLCPKSFYLLAFYKVTSLAMTHSDRQMKAEAVESCPLLLQPFHLWGSWIH